VKAVVGDSWFRTRIFDRGKLDVLCSTVNADERINSVESSRGSIFFFPVDVDCMFPCGLATMMSLRMDRNV
jgi:hypothetical protein